MRKHIREWPGAAEKVSISPGTALRNLFETKIQVDAASRMVHAEDLE